MTTKLKLWLAFGVVTVMLVISCTVILWNVRTIDRTVEGMEHARSYVADVRGLTSNILRYANSVETFAVAREQGESVRATAIMSEVTDELKQHGEREMSDVQHDFSTRLVTKWMDLTTLGATMLAVAESEPAAGPTRPQRFRALHREIDVLAASEMLPEAITSYQFRRQAVGDAVTIIRALVLVLMIAGTLTGAGIGILASRAILLNELEIKSGSEWLRVTLTSIGDGVITTNAKGRVTFLNPVAESLTGWSRAEATKGSDGGVPIEDVFNIVNESSRLTVESPIQRALREGIIVGLANHTILVSKSGTEIPIDDSGAPIRRSDGQIVGAVLVFRDVTEHKRQEKLVKDAFDYASNILDTQREPFLVLDKSLRVTSANGAFYRAFHVEPETTVGRFVYDLGDGQWNIPKLRELLEEVLLQRHAFEGFEVSHDFPGGVGRKTMMINARRMRKLGDDSELILLAIEDITDRESAQRAQRDSEVRFRRLFETAKDGILILDANTRKVTDANAFMCGLTGLDSAQLLGKELYEIGMYKDVEENKEAFRELQRTGYLRHEHLPVKRPGGGQVDVEFIANVYREGPKLVAQCNVRDISERSRLEREISKQSEALAAQSQSKDEFLAMLSHELRNPLAPIRAAVQLLKMHELSDAHPVQRQAREIIERQVGILTRMVSDLLEVSRVVSGRIQLDLKPVDVKHVITHAIQSTAMLFEQRSHHVEIVLCDETVWVLADATRLEEVLVNLLNNAAKYTPDGGRVVVSCDRDTARTFIRVRDNGVGIDEELLPRIFDLFTQADRSLARSSGGLGIGLSLAHRLVGQHGGTIEARSEGPEKGSEFIISLPLIDQPEAVPEPEAPLQPLDSQRPEGAVRVLVVDDNIDLVTMLAGVLRHKGYSVRSAHTGPDGLLIAQQWQPDITLLDIGLPGLDGYEVARRLRAAEVSNHRDDTVTRMKLLALTGYGRDADVALAMEAGFDGHLVKPCDMDELERLMRAPVK